MRTSKMHSVRKRMISNIYSKSYVQSSEEFQRVSQNLVYDRLLPKVSSFAEKKEAVDVLALNWSATMDLVTGFIFGAGVGANFLQNEAIGAKWLHEYNCRRPYGFWYAELPTLTSFMRRMRMSLYPVWVDEATAFIETWTMGRCKAAAAKTQAMPEEEKRENGSPKLVFDHLTKAVNASSIQDYSLGSPELQVASECHDHLGAGHDTSGIALLYLFWELSRRAELQTALRRELSGLNAPIRLSEQKELPSPHELDELPLLHAVIMETLRIHSPIASPQPRMTPATRLSVAGSPPLDPGIRISSQVCTLHRNADVYPEPESWQPSRWLGVDNEQMAEMNRWFWAFGSGGRMCIGRNIAMQRIISIRGVLAL